MTVAELRYALTDMPDDAEVVVTDGASVRLFGPRAVHPGEMPHQRDLAHGVVWIDLTSPDCMTLRG